MYWSGVNGAGGDSFFTTVKGGLSPANPLTGSVGAPVTKVRKLLLCSALKAVMALSKSRKHRESAWYPCCALMCDPNCSRLQCASSNEPTINEDSSCVDHRWHVDSGSSSEKALRKAATCASTAVTNVVSATSVMYSSTLLDVTERLQPPGFSSICGDPGRVKSTHNCAKVSEPMSRMLPMFLYNSGSTSRSMLVVQGPSASTRCQKRGCNCKSTKRLSKMHFATTWPRSRKRSLTSEASSLVSGRGKSQPFGTPSLKSRGSELLRRSATCA
mmetsp:Transcript_43574/g.100385  ORF Transcript_43574/g.100385 Transcript_43574/m.100385 type:complete len:272 (-) Transcript_43574:4434-5249(-)